MPTATNSPSMPEVSDAGMITLTVILIIVVFIFVVWLVKHANKRNQIEEEQRKQEEQQALKEKEIAKYLDDIQIQCINNYFRLIKENNIPTRKVPSKLDPKPIVDIDFILDCDNRVNLNYHILKVPCTLNGNQYGVAENWGMWLDNSTLSFFPDRDCFCKNLSVFRLYKNDFINGTEDPQQYINDIPYIQIPLSKIQSFQLIGDKHTTTSISGGGGGGSSIGGAIIGGVIAGGAGAIIGSRKAVDEIKSETKIVDERSVILRYYDDNDVLSVLQISPNAFELFLKWFPEKEYDYLTTQQKAGEGNGRTVQAQPNIKERLETLEQLKNDGLITEEEYNNKRQDILKEI